LKTSDQFLRVAKVTGPHGLDGRLKLAVITDIAARFTPGSTLYLKTGNEFTPFESVKFVEQPGKDSILKLKEVNDRDTALSLKGVEIFIVKDDAEVTRDLLDGNEFYYYDLIGCEVFCSGKKFGNVADIMEIGGSSILVLNDVNGKEFMIPFISSMVDTGNIADRKIDINPIEGLIDQTE
jgi:16S rRNA processing protein RimM